VTIEEHSQIVREESDGNLLIGIDRSFARKFYTDVPNRVVEEQTGETPYVAKFIVLVCLIASPLCFLAAAVLSVIYFAWWSILIIPVAAVLWLLYSGASSAGTTRIIGISIFAVAAIALQVFHPISWSFTPFLLVLSLALWLNRFMYVAATFFLRAFVIRNHRAFAFVHENLTLKRA
jgi:hypothetical protein